MAKSNDKTKYILYTEEQGGDFRIVDKVVAKHDPQDTEEFFNETKKSGILLFTVGDRTIRIKPKYMALVEVADDFDFVLGRARDSRKEEPKDGAKES